MKLRALLPALLLTLALAPLAHAQTTKTSLLAQLNACIYNNTSGAVTPACVNALVTAVINSVCGIVQASDCVLPTGAATANLGFTPLAPANNLSDIPDPAAARVHLGVPSLGTSTFGPDGTTNPYAGPYPSWLYGLGGLGFPSTAPLATNVLYNGNGSSSLANTTPYGGPNTACALNVATGANIPCGISGYTNPAQVSFYVENGSSALTMEGYTMPLMGWAAGTFAATSFTPTTPIPITSTVFVAVGMWVRSNDSPAFNGQVTSWTVNGSNQITQINVSNWYQMNLGAGNTAGTPSGTALMLNPQDKIWTILPTITLSTWTTTGTVTNGSNVITGVANTQQAYANGQFLASGTLFPANTYITAVGASTLTVSQAATGATTPGATLSISAGTQMNKSVAAEVDITNTTFAYSDLVVKGTYTSVNGSYAITSVTNATSLRPNMNISGPNIGFNTVDSINGSTVTLRTKATGAGSLQAYVSFTTVDEGGTGIDCGGVVLQAHSCFSERGNVADGFVSYGAGNVSFLVQPNGTAGIPNYGFLVDHSITPTAFTYGDFGILSAAGVPVFTVSSSGAITAPQITLTGSAAQLTLNGPTGTYKGLTIADGANTRWTIATDGSSASGTNNGTGVNLNFSRYNDIGLVDSPLTINRQFGTVGISTYLAINNAALWVPPASCGSVTGSTKCVGVIDPNGNFMYIPAWGTY